MLVFRRSYKITLSLFANFSARNESERQLASGAVLAGNTNKCFCALLNPLCTLTFFLTGDILKKEMSGGGTALFYLVYRLLFFLQKESMGISLHLRQ